MKPWIYLCFDFVMILALGRDAALAQAGTPAPVRTCELLHDRPADSTPLRYRGGRFFGIRADNRRHLNGLVALDQNCRVLFDRFLDHPEASEVRIYAADSLDDGIVAAGWI